MSRRLQEILNEASQKVREWPEWRKSEALRASERCVDAGSVGSEQQESANPPGQRGTPQLDK
ncbi:MAG: hypothetical protein WBW31_08145 [Candidatus Sulfotelmatobacter sp.]